MRTSPGSLESLRRSNRARVIRVLQERAQASRAEIARETGLSRTVVSSLVAELLEEGVVVEQQDCTRQAPTPSGGRPPTLLTLEPSSGAFVGLAFAHDAVHVLVVDRSGTPLAGTREELDVDHHAGEALERSVRLVHRTLREADVRASRVLAVGAAVAAPLRAGRGDFATSAIFPSWSEIDVAEELNVRLGFPVEVGNDANLGALAEAAFGAGRGTKNLVYVMLSAGVGAGLLIGGRLHEGETGTAGELGHLVIQPEGDVCRCGNRGCLETVAGSSALIRALEPAHGPLAFPDLLRLLRERDRAALRVVADAGRAVGRALAGVCSVLDPGLVVVGGELAAGGEPLLHGIRETLDRDTSAATGHRYKVVPGMLGAAAEVRGAAMLAMSRAPVEALIGLPGG